MLTQYRYFVAVIDHGGMTAAANALRVSQPAISRSLQSLEFQLDAVLLDRATGKVTSVGAMVLRRARLLLAEQQSLVADVSAAGATENTAFVNGSPMTAIALLPRIIARLATERPELRISVRGDNGANYRWKIDALLGGEIDVAVTIADPALADAGLLLTPLFEPELRIVLGRATIAGDASPDLTDLLDRRWIMPPQGSSPRAVVENEFRMRGHQPPRDTIEISDWRIALDLVQSTNWVTAVPFHPACFDDRFDRLRVLPIRFGVRPLAITLATRPLARKRGATEAFVTAAQAVVDEHGDE